MINDKDKEIDIAKLLALIVQIILLILQGSSASTATGKVAGLSGVEFAKLWKYVPRRYK